MRALSRRRLTSRRTPFESVASPWPPGTGATCGPRPDSQWPSERLERIEQDRDASRAPSGSVASNNAAWPFAAASAPPSEVNSRTASAGITWKRDPCFAKKTTSGFSSRICSLSSASPTNSRSSNASSNRRSRSRAGCSSSTRSARTHERTGSAEPGPTAGSRPRLPGGSSGRGDTGRATARCVSPHPRASP